MGMLKYLVSFLRPHPEYHRLAAEFRAHRNSVGRRLQRPAAILSMVAWLGFAFDTDPKLHPEYPDMLWFRLGLSACAFILFIASFFEKLRGEGLGWLHFLMCYLFFSTAFFTGRIADDANYVSGLQIIVMIVILAPVTIRTILWYYSVSVLFFGFGVFIGRPDLSTAGAIYSMQNLTLSYLIGLVFGFVLANNRFDSFYKAVTLEENRDEIAQRMIQIQSLKRQQDGDYFLTSLLLQPLILNDNKSKSVTTEFFLQQKKQFEFGNRKGEIGGDICISGNLRIGRSLADHRRFIVFMNGDAMGKSLQGAGGALIAGVLINSMIAQAARNDKVIDTTPMQWLTDVFEELNRIFLSFDGSMLLSAVVGMIAEDTQELWYFNAEHPYPVLYRSGAASFLSHSEYNYKLGMMEDATARISHEQLMLNDIVILASDGRDDLELQGHSEDRAINEDENLFLRCVERGEGTASGIFNELLTEGSLTDDFSLVRIEVTARASKPAIDETKQSLPELLSQLVKNKNFARAASIIEERFSEITMPSSLRMAGFVFLKIGQYEKSIDLFQSSLERSENDHKALFGLAQAFFRHNQFEQAYETIQKAIAIQPADNRYLALSKKINERM